MFLSTLLNRLDPTYTVAFIVCISNGFFYAFAVFSTRLRLLLGFSSTDVVLLGVLSQAGLGFFQYPTTLLLAKAQRKGVSQERLDVFQNVWCLVLFLFATLGMGGVIYNAEQGRVMDQGTILNFSCVCFLFWGQGVGTAFNSCSAVVNFNYQHANSKRRIALAGLSSAVGLGGVLLVLVYQYLFAKNQPLSAFFFFLAAWYIALFFLRAKWIRRIKHKQVTTHASTASTSDHHEDIETNAATATPTVSLPVTVIHQQSVWALLKSRIVWLTFVPLFLGIGIGGTFLASLGNVGVQIDPSRGDVTFLLVILFLSMQTVGRLGNALAYAFGEWGYIFAVYQIATVVGIIIFVGVPSSAAYYGATTSSAVIGYAFGGLHAAYPILAATVFPGNAAVDYAQSVGLAFFMSSLGVVVVGQLTTAVYKASSLVDLRAGGFYYTFIFFLSLSLVSTVAALVLGYQIQHTQRRNKLNAIPNLDPIPVAETESIEESAARVEVDDVEVARV